MHVGWLTLHENPINIMHKNAIKGTHALNGNLIRWNSATKLKTIPSLMHIHSLRHSVPYSHFSHTCRFYLLSHSPIVYIHTLIEQTPKWIAFNDHATYSEHKRKMNGGYIIFAVGKQSPTKLTAIIFVLAFFSSFFSLRKLFFFSVLLEFLGHDSIALHGDMQEMGAETMNDKMYGHKQRKKAWKEREEANGSPNENKKNGIMKKKELSKKQQQQKIQRFSFV